MSFIIKNKVILLIAFLLTIVSYSVENASSHNSLITNLAFASGPYTIQVNYIGISNICLSSSYIIIYTHYLTFESSHLSKLLILVYKSIAYVLKNISPSSKNEKLAFLNANTYIFSALSVKPKIFLTLINLIKI